MRAHDDPIGSLPLLGWAIVCDFDGTIARADVTDLLLEKFAALEWKLVERSWQAGRISSRECLRRQVELLRVTRAEINAMLPGISLDPAFPAFVTAAMAAGCEVRIASEGFQQVIRALLSRIDVPPIPIAATYLVPAGPDSWMLGFPNAMPACATDAATCKCAVAAALRRSNRRVILVGDGLSDFCLARSADLVFARGKLLEHCRAEHIPHEPAADFAAVLRYIQSLASGASHRTKPVRAAGEAHGG